MLTPHNTPRPAPSPLHAAGAWRRLLYPVVLILATLTLGTVGYALIEGWPLLDALYMTIITFTTIGYGEPRALSDTGRMYTIGLIVMTLVVAGYSVSSVASFIFEGELNRVLRGRRMDRQISEMANHVIVCGAGRIGEHIVNELLETGEAFVLVESDEERLAELDTKDEIVYLHADATHDHTLQLAGIERAHGLFAALGSDRDNIFLVLSARSLNPDLHIVARLNSEENADKLRRAGADEVISPSAIGGLRMASVMLRPTVVSFLDEMLRVPGEALRLEELAIGEGSKLTGHSLADASIPQQTGLLVVAVVTPDGGYHFNPGADTVIHAGDTLIVMGTPEQRERFEALQRGETPQRKQGRGVTP